MYCLYFILILYLPKCYSIRQAVIPNNERGVFQSFLYKYLVIVGTGCEARKLKRHCRDMYKELKQMGFKETKALSKIYKELSEMYVDDIGTEANTYRKEVDRKAPRRDEFFKTMNEIFRLQEHVRFEDYLDNLRDYCTDNKLSIDEESHKLLHDVILSSVKNKLTKKEQRKLRKNIKDAAKEYEKIELAEFAKIYNFPTFTTVAGHFILPKKYGLVI